MAKTDESVCKAGAEKESRFVRSVLAHGALLLGGLVAALFGVEMALRIHNPFEFRQKGDRIYLPVGRTYEFTNRVIVGLDSTIHTTRNSLGFRGQAPPEDFDRHLTVVAVGGSTTECLLLSDGQTWVDRLGERLRERLDALWINNAGLDGHSTFGHAVLLQDYIVDLNPDVLLLLVGVNDVNRSVPRSYDDLLMRFGGQSPLPRRLVSHSELASLLYNTYRSYSAKRSSLGHAVYDVTAAPTVVVSKALSKGRQTEQTKMVEAYTERLQRLLHLARKSGALPVLITQPGLLGPAIDNVTGIDLKTCEISMWGLGGMSGMEWWEILELYNDATRSLGQIEGLPVIDLARKLPKSSSNFYDAIHFTNAGAERIAEILAAELAPVLETRFPEHSGAFSSAGPGRPPRGMQ